MNRQDGSVARVWRTGRAMMVSSVCMSLFLLGCEAKKGAPVDAVEKAGGDDVATTANSPDAGGTSGGDAGEESSSASRGGEEEEARAEKDQILSTSARSLVKDWQRAQNEGDFKAYSRLYASRMTGVKRVGPRKFVYDRAGWLQDRERMFKKKMAVTLDDIEVMPSGRTVVVTMTQTWASGSFKDTGPKRLVLLMNEEGELQVSREEMLESRLLEAREKVPALEVGGVGFAVHESQPKWMVFPLALESEQVNHRKATSIRRGRSAAVELLPDAMKPAWKELVGKPMRLVVGAGGTCEAKVARVVAIASAIPHFGQEQTWNGDPGFDEDARRLSDEQVAVELSEIASDEGLYLGVELEGADDAACKGWSWGSSTATAPTYAMFETVKDGQTVRDVTQMFQALPGFELIQKDYPDSSKKWASGEAITVRRAKLGEREFIYVGASVGTMCDDFLGEFWAIFEAGSDYVLMTDGENPGDFKKLKAVVAGQGDAGDVTFLGEGTFFEDMAMIQSTGATWRVTHWWRIPYYDCPC